MSEPVSIETRVNQRFDDLESKVDGLEGKVDGIAGQLAVVTVRGHLIGGRLALRLDGGALMEPGGWCGPIFGAGDLAQLWGHTS